MMSHKLSVLNSENKQESENCNFQKIQQILACYEIRSCVMKYLLAKVAKDKQKLHDEFKHCVGKFYYFCFNKEDLNIRNLALVRPSYVKLMRGPSRSSLSEAYREDITKLLAELGIITQSSLFLLTETVENE